MTGRDYEQHQHRLLSMIEQLHREGASEREIVARLKEVGGNGNSPTRPHESRPGRGRLARWAGARLRL
jgi:hypothetical protein